MAKKPISKQELEKRINGYIMRIRRKDVPKIPLKQKGLYRVVSGSQGNYSHRETLDVVQGRFIDAIAYAVQQPGFTGWWCGWDAPDNCNHGKLEQIDPVKLPTNKKLDYLAKPGRRIK
tara:strand:- start:296 stop:649 length:354 start_codon:yes stop_codon:yes gene_type:complete